MKMSNMNRTSKPSEEDDDDEDDDDSDDEDDKHPELETAMIDHLGSVNRIRVRKTYEVNTLYARYFSRNSSVLNIFLVIFLSNFFSRILLFHSISVSFLFS